MKKTGLLVGNWKMNGGISELAKFLDSIEKSVDESPFDVVICPPFPLLPYPQNRKKKADIKIGAQDCHHEKKGAFTGDVSASLLAEIGCSHVIIGHSERRMYHHESNDIICKKMSLAIKSKLIPILCVGETYNQRESSQVQEVISTQVKTAFTGNKKASQIIVAYEPVWSIGTGKIPTVKEITEVCTIIMESLKAVGIESGQKKIHILYGGSVNDNNVAELNKVEMLSGFLVGSASLDSKKFSNIINSRKN